MSNEFTEQSTEKSIHFLDDISQNCHSELPRRRLGDNDGFQLEVVPRMNGVSFTYLFIVFGLPTDSAHTGRYWAHLGTVFENQIINSQVPIKRVCIAKGGFKQEGRGRFSQLPQNECRKNLPGIQKMKIPTLFCVYRFNLFSGSTSYKGKTA